MLKMKYIAWDVMEGLSTSRLFNRDNAETKCPPITTAKEHAQQSLWGLLANRQSFKKVGLKRSKIIRMPLPRSKSSVIFSPNV